MIYLQLFWAFFISNILGYGGGPPSIPLIQNEVVDHYGWMTMQEFGEVLAVANALPSPIATKLAGYVGYQVAGVPGAAVALLATVAPTAIAMIALLGALNLFRDAPQVKAMTQSVRPIVTVLLGIMTYEFLLGAVEGIGWMQTAILSVAAFLLLEKWKLHPALVILLAMAYGFFFIN
ncbi:MULTISPECIES: chromate transporter [Brevibacillus]|jgi:chromate transporter|uniref:chromate transporter n=1 Tax=Brevibacillus TaxID=55080 RepID=UPI0004698D5A|nr:chromate transporter [Brevibacillus borstelensis]MBE5398419.1 chromate transporter [Brevibacillus borstelensis]MCC0565891.1 chromate transporter [Brevibacillus borstelensis]MCM3471105.1 chromate transporter [Brevibacillus borstelensis]MCM3561644.1 chromate transporter [Brevibacillus borstelensis]MCM3590532.1 chromate transporter [Brevibacillus borstelensis]